MHRTSQEAQRSTAEFNGSYHGEAGVRTLVSQLIGKPVDESVVALPPFYTDFGKNIAVGSDLFINMGCKFQHQGT